MGFVKKLKKNNAKLYSQHKILKQCATNFNPTRGETYVFENAFPIEMHVKPSHTRGETHVSKTHVEN
jgi:hypothetical protein